MARLTAILADGALLHLVVVVISQAKYYIQRFHRFFTRRLSSDMPLAAYSPLMFPTWEQ
jgi:hypothetical protein